MKKKTYLLIALSIVSMGMNAQNSEKSSLENNVPEFVKTMKIGGTIRSKYEYQTEEGEGRFEVRTARINVAGNVTKEVSYKAEIDLCDEGKIKMLMLIPASSLGRHCSLPLVRSVCHSLLMLTVLLISSTSPTARSSPSRWATCATWVPKSDTPGM